MGKSPAIDLWTVGWGNDVATTLPLGVFTQRNFVADFFERMSRSRDDWRTCACAGYGPSQLLTVAAGECVFAGNVVCLFFFLSVNSLLYV